MHVVLIQVPTAPCSYQEYPEQNPEQSKKLLMFSVVD